MLSTELKRALFSGRPNGPRVSWNAIMVLRLTRSQVRRVDQLAVQRYALPGVVLMENAGRGAAEVIRLECKGDLQQVILLIGPGNNGGDGFVVARHLHNHRVQVELILCCDPEKIKGDAAVNYEIVEKMSLPMSPWRGGEQLKSATLLVDALLGTLELC